MKRLCLLILMLLTLFPSVKAQIDAERVTTIGRNAIFFKDYVLAIQYFNTAIDVAPHRAEPYFYRAVAKFNLEDYFGTESDCDSCIVRNPFIYRAYFLRALARHSLGKDSLALADYRVVLRDNPDDQGALHNSALLYINHKDSTQARHTLDRLQRFYPSYGPGNLMDGSMALQLGDTLSAKSLFEKGLKLSPESPSPYLSLANISYSQGNYSQAKKYLDSAVEYAEEDPGIYTFRGLTRFQLNDLRGAMEDYTRAISISPNDLLALYNRAILRTRVGEFDPAVEDFDRVLMLDPSNSFARYNRALIENNQGNHERAIADLNIIIEKYPTFLPAYVQRATAKRSLGQIQASEIDFYRASQMMNDPSVRRKLAQSGKTVSAEEGDNPDTKDTRDEKDENIRKFRMLVYDSRSHGYNRIYREQNGIRGRVQDRKTAISPEPLWVLSYYSDPGVDVQPLSRKSVKELRLPETPYGVEIVRTVPILTPTVIAEHKERISKPLGDSEQEFFGRIMDFMTLRDLDSAKELALQGAEKYPDALYMNYILGICELLDLTIDDAETLAEQSSSDRLPATVSPDTRQSSNALVRKKRLSDAANSFEVVLSRLPDFYPALYNLAYIRYYSGDYTGAIDLLTQCISLEPNQGAAYFNRALCHYALGDKIAGDKDMSHAGSLGIYRSYSIIKRMQ